MQEVTNEKKVCVMINVLASVRFLTNRQFMK